MDFDFSKNFTIKNAYSHINEMFNCDDNRDRIFIPEAVKCSFGYVRGFYYNENCETIFLIHYDKNGNHIYSDIFNINEDDAYLCAKKILNDEFTLAVNRHHPLYVGEKVFDNNEQLICEIVEINGKKVKVSQEKYIEENKKMFNLDREDDAMEWEADDDAIYQFADGVTDREGNPVCYEHTSSDYPFYSPYLYENLYAFEVEGLSVEDTTKYIKEENVEGNDDEVVYNNEVVITKGTIEKAEQVLIDNGIEKDEAWVVLQALGYVLFDGELYPESI